MAVKCGVISVIGCYISPSIDLALYEDYLEKVGTPSVDAFPARSSLPKTSTRSRRVGVAGLPIPGARHWKNEQRHSACAY